MAKIKFISRNTLSCGVADYGRRLNDILKKSKHQIDFEQVDGLTYSLEGYDLALYNYHISTLPFLQGDLTPKIPHVAIHHEGGINFNASSIIDVDTTRGGFSLLRPLFEGIQFNKVVNEVPVIGSFGFGFSNKGFPKLAQLVKNQYQKAKIRVNIPFATFGDANGSMALNEVAKMRSILQGTEIEFQATHELYSHQEILQMLSESDINIFPYDLMPERSLSSTIDFALSVNKPIGITNSAMFRHIYNESIDVDKTTIKEIIENAALTNLTELHSNKNLVEKFDFIIDEILRKWIS
jgi:hypothetical protein